MRKAQGVDTGAGAPRTEVRQQKDRASAQRGLPLDALLRADGSINFAFYLTGEAVRRPAHWHCAEVDASSIVGLAGNSHHKFPVALKKGGRV